MIHLFCLYALLSVPVKPAVPKINIWWHITSIAMAQADVATTMYVKNKYGGIDEHDPLARPIVNLPNPAYEAVSMALVVGLNLVADRMNRSVRFHKFARPILAIQIGGNAAGFSYTAINCAGVKSCRP